MPKPQSTSYQAPALEKGLDILELLADEPTGLSQKVIADRLERSVGEIFRMLVSLERRGYVNKRDDDNYELTLRLFELSHRHPPSRRLIQAALGPMQEFATTVCQSIHLAVLYNKNIMVVANADSPTMLGLTVRLGAQLPITTTASGRVLMAYQDTFGLDRFRQVCPELSTRTKAGKQMQTHLALIRKRGYELKPSERITGVTDISVPIFDMTNTAIAALTVPFLTQTDSPQNQKKSLAELITTSQTISATLGWIANDQ